MTRKNRFFNGVLIFFSGISAYAGTLGAVANTNFHYLGRITGGVDFVSTTNHSQILNLLPEVSGSSDYRSNNGTQTEGLIGGFLGFEKSFFNYGRQWLWQFGVSYYQQLENYTDAGVLYQTLGTVTQNYSYQYTINSEQVYAENRLLLPVREKYYPYVLVGLGAAFNRSRNYQVVAYDSTSGDAPLFANNTKAAFAYLLGAGIDLDICKGGRLGVGYRYAGLGIPSLNTSPAQTSNATLNAGTLSNNQIVAEFSLLIP